MAKRHEEMAREFLGPPWNWGRSEADVHAQAALLARVEREAIERAAAEVERIWHTGNLPGMGLIAAGLGDAIRALLEDGDA